MGATALDLIVVPLPLDFFSGVDQLVEEIVLFLFEQLDLVFYLIRDLMSTFVADLFDPFLVVVLEVQVSLKFLVLLVDRGHLLLVLELQGLDLVVEVFLDLLEVLVLVLEVLLVFPLLLLDDVILRLLLELLRELLDLLVLLVNHLVLVDQARLQLRKLETELIQFVLKLERVVRLCFQLVDQIAEFGVFLEKNRDFS